MGFGRGYLCRDQRLSGVGLRSQRIGCFLDRRGRLEFFLWGNREVLALVRGDVILGVNLGWLGGHSWGSGTRTSASNDPLSLGRIVSNILLCDICGTRGVVTGELLNLLGLLVDDIGGIFDVMVNDLLVSLIDERRKEEGRGGDECKTPQWDDLDQVVRGEGTEEGLMTVSTF